jgi:heat shock protein HslJ
MRRLGVCLLLVVLAHPGLAQPAPEFPAKAWFVVETLNGVDMHDNGLTFFADIALDDTVEPTAGGSAGCNIWRARPEIGAPDRFRLGPIATTRKLCARGNVMQIEAIYLAAMARVSRWRIDGAALVLSGEQTILRLSRRAEQP